MKIKTSLLAALLLAGNLEIGSDTDQERPLPFEARHEVSGDHERSSSAGKQRFGSIGVRLPSVHPSALLVTPQGFEVVPRDDTEDILYLDPS